MTVNSTLTCDVVVVGAGLSGLAAHPHPLRSMRAHLHVRHLHRRNRHLLAQSMIPEPKKIRFQTQWPLKTSPF